MGLKGIHERTGSTEMWCIFRYDTPDVKRTCCKCNCQEGEPTDHRKTLEFGCQVDIENMDDSFTLADTSFCSMKSTGNVKDISRTTIVISPMHNYVFYYPYF
jgi:hypothetical protein